MWLRVAGECAERSVLTGVRVTVASAPIRLLAGAQVRIADRCADNGFWRVFGIRVSGGCGSYGCWRVCS